MVATSNWMHKQSYQFQVTGVRDVQNMAKTISGASSVFQQAQDSFEEYQGSVASGSGVFDRLGSSVKTVGREAGDFTARLRSAFSTSSDSSIELKQEIRGLTGAVKEFQGKQDFWAAVTTGKVNKAYRLNRSGHKALALAYAGSTSALGDYGKAMDVAVEGLLKYNSVTKIADKLTTTFDKSTEVLTERLDKGVNSKLIDMESNFNKLTTAITASIGTYEGFKLQDTITEAGRATKLLVKDQKVLEKVATDTAVAVGRPYEKVIEDLQGALKIGFRAQTELKALAMIGQQVEKLTGASARSVIDLISQTSQVAGFSASEMERLGRALVNVSQDSSTSIESMLGDFDQFRTAILNVPKEARANAVKSIAVTRAALSDAFADSGSFQDIFGSLFSFDQKSFGNVAKIQALLSSSGIQANMMELYKSAQRTGDSLPVVNAFIDALGQLELHSTKGRMVTQRLSEMFGVQTAELQRLSEMQKQGQITLSGIASGFNEGWIEGKRFDTGLGEISNTLSEMIKGVSSATTAVVAEFGSGLASVSRTILKPFAGALRYVTEWFHNTPDIVKSASAVFGVFFGGWLLKKIVKFTAVTLAAQGATSLLIGSVNKWGSANAKERVIGFLNNWGAGLSVVNGNISKFGPIQRAATLATIKDTAIRKGAVVGMKAYALATAAASKSLAVLARSGDIPGGKMWAASSRLADKSAQARQASQLASSMTGATITQVLFPQDGKGFAAKLGWAGKKVKGFFNTVGLLAKTAIVGVFTRVVIPVLSQVAGLVLSPWIKWPLLIYAGFKLLKGLFTAERIKAIFSGIGKAIGWLAGSLGSLFLEVIVGLPVKLFRGAINIGVSIMKGITQAVNKHGGLGGAIMAGLGGIGDALKKYVWDPFAEGISSAFKGAITPFVKTIAEMRRLYAETKYAIFGGTDEYLAALDAIAAFEKRNTKAAEDQAAAKAAATRSEEERIRLLKGSSLSDPAVKAYLRRQYRSDVSSDLGRLARANKARRIARLNTPLGKPIYVGREQTPQTYMQDENNVPLPMPASPVVNLTKLESTSQTQNDKLDELIRLQSEQVTLMAREAQNKNRMSQFSSGPSRKLMQHAAGVLGRGGW